MRPPPLILLAIFLSAPPPSGPAAEYQPHVGRRHADFTLPEIRTGKPVSLNDYRGKKVLLIHFASW
jgi:hypothetical protein